MSTIKKKLIAAFALAMVGILTASLVQVYNETKTLAAINPNVQTYHFDTSKYDDQIKEAEANKKKYEQQASNMKQQIASLKTEYDKITKYIEYLDNQMASLAVDLYNTNLELERLNEKILETQNQLFDAQNIRDEQYKKMKARIKYVYENGESSVIDIIFSTGSMADLLNRVEYVAEISKYDDKLFAEFIKSADRIADTKAKLKAQKDEAEAAKVLIQQGIDNTERMTKEKNKALEKCAANIGISTELYAEYLDDIESSKKTISQVSAERDKAIKEEEKRRKEEEERLEKLRQEELLKKQLESSGANKPVMTDKSALKDIIWPLSGYGTISSYFGPRIAPIAGASTFHQGVDVPAPIGTPVHAMLAGKVIKVSYNNSAGHYLFIDHGNGIMTAYLHSSKILVNEGDYVQQGQTIMLVGASGAATGPHLDFRIRLDGTYYNPLNFVKY